jgi:conjugative relaxase-like TrwC/TraI family protein
MLRINPFKSSQGVMKYYETSLASGDYYLKDNPKENSQEMIGNWGGLLSQMLGLEGQVSKEDFFKLVQNINPQTNEQLTIKNVNGRRVGYDFNFHVPKSFSVMQAMTGDDRLTDIFREAVDESMREMEGTMLTRVRKNGEMDDRQTGNMSWAEFVHFTARPVGGVPDPHLHAHCFVFNATYDPVEQKIKAGQFVDIKRDSDLSQAQFHSRLMAKTRALGYEVKLTPKGWEIDGVPQSVIDRFSRRTQQVEKQAEELGITDDKAKDKLGATTRENKQKDFSMGELQNIWGMQMSSLEKEALQKVKTEADNRQFQPLHEIEKTFEAERLVDTALQDILERRSVASFKDIAKRALMYGKGDLDKKAIEEELKHKERLEQIIALDEGKNKKLYTTEKLLNEEKAILGLINSGRGKYGKIKYNPDKLNQEPYSQEQIKAVSHLLDSTDAVTSVRGGAGTGKTTMLGMAVKYFNNAGKQVFLFAPSSQASRGVLRDDGFSEADTVAKYLQSKDLQEKSKGQIVWIDEAGLLSVPDLKKVLETARENGARVVLAGDTRQHSAVERGDGLRLAETKSDLQQAELKETKRQKDEEYKKAVELIRDGKTGEGLDKLEQMGSIVEIQNPLERYQSLAKDYAELSKDKSVLVVTPTHTEGLAINKAIRDELKTRQKLGDEEMPFEVLKNRNLTEVERKPEFLQDGSLVRFSRNFQGINKDELYKVKSEKDLDGKTHKVILGKDEAKTRLWDGAEKYYNVYAKDTIPVSTNDKLRVTQNGKDTQNKELLNGQDLTVTGFDKSGQIMAKNKDGQNFILPKSFQDFTHGYYSTSHGSQGKTADMVLIGQASPSFPASDQKQFYVSASRGREGIKIYTDDKQGLKEAVEPTRNRMSALELADLKKQKEIKQDKQPFIPKELKQINSGLEKMPVNDKNSKMKDNVTAPKMEQKPKNPFIQNPVKEKENQPNQPKPQKTWGDITKDTGTGYQKEPEKQKTKQMER